MRNLAIVLLLASVLAAGAANAECVITGTVTAEPNLDLPQYGDWMYTLELTWDTDSPYGLSHFDLILDTPDGTCDCSAFAAGLAWVNPVGTSVGVPEDCVVDFELFLECNGDPSVPGEEGIILKFEPIEDDTCEPGPTGTGTFVFYSDLGPAPIDENALLLIQKFSGESCSGGLTGDFPAFPCDPVAAEAATWGRIKTLFDR